MKGLGPGGTENAGGKDFWRRLFFDGMIGREVVSDYRCGVSRGQERHRVAAAALAVGAIPLASMDVGMAWYDPCQRQQKQEEESHEHHARIAGSSR